MEFWDIYDSDKKQTGRTMKRNDWNLKIHCTATTN